MASTLPKKQTILLVDDDDNIVEIFTEVLLDLSFNVVRAHNGAEALELIKHQKFDCIVTDLVMPVMDGVELISHLQALKHFIPFFFITGYQDYPLESLNQYKPRAIILKPFDFEEAAMLIKNHLMRL